MEIRIDKEGIFRPDLYQKSIKIMRCCIRTILLLSFLISSFSPLLPQEIDKKDFIRIIQEADIFYYYDEDYEKAASLYEPLVKSNPENCNIAAKLGICYLNMDGRKQDALKLLKSASANIVTNDKEYIEYGEKAPLDTYLYLAIAYHINDSLEKAISLFNDVKDRLGDQDVFRVDYIDNQIRDCRYAIEMKKKPLTIVSELMVPWLKDYPGACNPVISKNDSVFIFTQKREGSTRILCSYNKDGWKNPVDITRQLGGYDRFYSNSITGNGKILVLYMDDGGDGNLYFAERKDSTWTKIKSPGKNINSIYWESHGFITPDGNIFYFSSNRPGGMGELDIWVSERNEDGTWKNPVNCGDVINTAFNEDTPFFDPATNALIYSSSGHISMGGYDVFRSIARYSGWTNPVGMPFAYNTTGENTFFILNNNAPGFITSLYDDKIESRNIYAIVAIDPADEITTTEGVITLQDGMNVDPAKTSIKLTDAKKGTLIRTINVNDDGKFRFEIKPGDYQLFVSHTGYRTDTLSLNLPLYFLSHYMAVNPTLVPEKVSGGDFLAIKNILFQFDSYDLNRQAISELESLKSILITNPELTIEVAGYTDSKGSSGYNMKLADKRARAVIDYLVSTVIPESRFVRKAFGESNFAAINTNPDGSDNPEGRKYNRRVTFGIVDPRTGVVLIQETYTPEHLRLASSMKYSIVLIKTKEKLPPGSFEDLKLGGILFVRSVESDSISLYALGLFYNRPDAIKYLGYVKGMGYNNAYIVNQYYLNNETKSLKRIAPIVTLTEGKRIYTIQLKASKSPLNIEQFSAIKDVREILGDDGYYRYVVGEYSELSKAKEAVIPIHEAGFKDAFIRELNILVTKE
jgi:outer membrane protein OmpA-like peptidoglycan-associated protein/tetratricopeptide (TPR) repeat protein